MEFQARRCQLHRMQEMRSSPNEGRDEHLSALEDPILLFVDDLSDILKLTRGAVRKAIQRGEFGPYLYIGRRLAVRRESFVAALKAREIAPPKAGHSRATRPIPDKAFLEKFQEERSRRT